MESDQCVASTRCHAFVRSSVLHPLVPVLDFFSPRLSSASLQALIREHHDDIAHAIVLEQGKTFADAKGDVLRGLQVCFLFLHPLPLSAQLPSGSVVS